MQNSGSTYLIYVDALDIWCDILYGHLSRFRKICYWAKPRRDAWSWFVLSKLAYTLMTWYLTKDTCIMLFNLTWFKLMIWLDITLYECSLTKAQDLVYSLRLAPGRPMLGMYGILIQTNWELWWMWPSLYDLAKLPLMFVTLWLF